jgi:hypothetical protein
MSPPARPRPPIRRRRTPHPRSSTTLTRAAKKSASGKVGVSENLRSSSASKDLSAMPVRLQAKRLCGRRQSRLEFIQTTFDMGFDRPKRRIQGRRRFGV